ncbi:hypothetical protein J6590_070265 [Homalodisca vitripennis]|nr:hypothetical protein J6590_070265 [Homalodisca vitripennis]
MAKRTKEIDVKLLLYAIQRTNSLEQLLAVRFTGNTILEDSGVPATPNKHGIEARKNHLNTFTAGDEHARHAKMARGAVDERARHTAAAFILPQCELSSVPVSVSQLVRFVAGSPFSFVVYALRYCVMFVPKPKALRAHTTRGPAPGADDEQTRREHDVTRSGQKSFRDTLENPFGCQ